jgi:hypothetical protein
MNIKLLFIAFFLWNYAVYAQHNCGVEGGNAQLIKERMIENRANIPTSIVQSIRSSRSVINIPVTVHFIGWEDATDYPNMVEFMGSFCRLQEDYAKFGVQFYIDSPFRYINDSLLHQNGHNNNAYSRFFSLKKANTLNLFVGPSTESPTSSYYLPSGDFVFLLDQMMGYDSSTLSHEIGHFFSVSHTFYGWEGYYNENEISDIEGINIPQHEPGTRIEFVRRSGGNCNSAADGFCDTPADYLSFRVGCNVSYDLSDTYGDKVIPDETNVMSYFTDECATEFTEEQRDAIIRDIYNRGWHNLGSSIIAETVGESEITNPVPFDGEYVSRENSSITLRWDAVENAAHYLILIDKRQQINPNVNFPNEIQRIIPATANPSYTFDGSMLSENYDFYKWTIIPMSTTHFCEEESNIVSFDYTYEVGISDEEAKNLVLSPNPANNHIIIESDETVNHILVYGMKGQLVLQSLSPTNNQIDVSGLSPGLYHIQIQTATGIITKKFIKN